MLKRDSVRGAIDMLSTASRIVVLCHANPDGDAIGSLLGLGQMLEDAYPDKSVVFVCKDPSPETFLFLQGVQRIQQNMSLQKEDVIVVVDSAEPKLTGLVDSHPEIFADTTRSINIDHHPTNTNFATINLIDATAASACEIVVAIADIAGWKITPEVATCLLTGVYTDTGGLLHSNTSVQVYRTVARLLRSGAQQQVIVNSVFRTAKLSTLKLWGRLLEKISLTDEGGAISAVTKGDFAATGAHYSELTGAIDYVNAVPGMRFSMILSERDGKVKGSLRTLRDDVDVAEMAGKFDGGGHKKAAGFALTGKLKPEVRWKVVEDE